MMKTDNIQPKRRSIRLKDYDYTRAGAYFITICAHRSQCLFGEIVNHEMRVNLLGQIVHDEWLNTTIIRPNIQLGEFIVMPNHLHGIIIIFDIENSPTQSAGRGDLRSPGIQSPEHPPISLKTNSLGAIMAGFKSAVTKKINILRGTPAAPVWQRNYWERVIRNENEILKFTTYIQDNPAKWAFDRLNKRNLYDLHN